MSRADGGAVRTLVVAALAVLLGAGAAVWWFVLRDDAPPPASLGDCVSAAGGPEAPDGEWVVTAGDPDDPSFVGYRMDETFAGETITKEAAGRTPEVEGRIEIDGDRVTSARVVAQLDALRSDRTARDSALRTRGLETDRFPEATFTLTEAIGLGADPARGEAVATTAVGTLDLHGVSRPVEIALEACWTGPSIRLSGATDLVLADHGIEPISSAIVEIAEEGVLELELTLEPPPGS